MSPSLSLRKARALLGTPSPLLAVWLTAGAALPACSASETPTPPASSGRSGAPGGAGDSAMGGSESQTAGAGGSAPGAEGGATNAGQGPLDSAGAGSTEDGGAGGGGGGGGAAGSSGAAPDGTGGSGEVPEPVITVSQTGSLITLARDSLKMVVDADKGARIVEFSLDGVNALVEDGANTGSTFWPSPQSVWSWPPPEEIDSGVYSVELTDNTARLISEAALGIVVTKTFVVRPDEAAIDVTYEMSGDAEFAPWEITRVPGGLTFFAPSGAPILDCLQGVESLEAMAWYTYDVDLGGQANSTDPASGEECSLPKLNQDGQGWLANANGDSGLLLLKRFPDIAPALFASAEAEVEVFANTPDPENNPEPYVEIEAQGPYGPQADGSTWTVTWSLDALDETSVLSAGSQELIDLVTSRLTP